MQIAKAKAANTLEVMKSEEGNESIDSIMAQAIGKQPLVSFSRAGDSAAQFIQLLQALEQQEHHQGWPLLSSLKVQVQKCDKCSREYCSSINYRRHLRVHHRLKTLDKDSAKSRDWLGAFWDKISLEDAKEVVSFKNVALEEVSGSSIIKALSTVVRKSGFSSLPQLYLKAGSEILDIIQGRPSRFPISSSELFTILDYASEKTFLCGSAASMQRYVFDGDVGKTGLETKNVVACTSFLLEQKLINAWRADKDAEALRFQKLLVEEEEAARKRRAEELEKKRLKRLKQKEQKEKERYGEKADVNETTDNTPEEKAVVNETIDDTLWEKTDVNETIDDTLGEEADVNETIDNVSEEKGNVNEAVDNTLKEKAVVNETIADTSGENTDVNETVDSASEEKALVKTMDVSETIAKAPEEKGDVNETDEASEEMLSAETSSPEACNPQIAAANGPNADQHLSTVEQSKPEEMPSAEISRPEACNLQINAADMPNLDQHLSTVEHSKPDIRLDLDFQAGFDGGQIDSDNISPVDESQFVQGGGWRWQRKRKVAGKYQLATSPGSQATQVSQAVAPTSSSAAQGSQASKLAVAPTTSPAAQDSRASKLSVAPTSSHAAPDSLASKLAVAPTCSHAAQDSRASKLAVLPTSSHAAQDSRASRLAAVKSRGRHKVPRTVSTGHKVWSPKVKREFDPYSSEARVQEAPNESAQTKEHAVVPSTTERESAEAVVEIQKETPSEPTQTRKHEVVPSPTFGRESLQVRTKPETPDEPDRIKEQSFMIGSIPVPLDDFINDNSEACNAQTAEPQTSADHVQDEGPKPDPVPSSTSTQTAEVWRDTLVLNGSRESESGGIEITPGNLFEGGDWESAICKTRAFLHQRWKDAIASEHFTLVSVLVSEDTDCKEKRLINVVGIVESPTPEAAKSEFSTKPKKGIKKKYIPKQRGPT